MGRIKTIAVVAGALAALPAAASSEEPRTAPDCRFEEARAYEDFGRIRVFTAGGDLYGCLTDVGRAHRLETGTIRARSTAIRRALFGVGDWVGFARRDRTGRTRVHAKNLRTGKTHGTAAGDAVTALVVNHDGTLAWIAGSSVRTKPANGDRRTLGSGASLDRAFLGIENDQGCAVTWKLDGAQRSSSIYCSRP